MRSSSRALSEEPPRAHKPLSHRLALAVLGVIALAAGVECWGSVAMERHPKIWVDAVVALIGSGLMFAGTLSIRSAGARPRWSKERLVAFSIAIALVTLVVLAIQYWLAALPWRGLRQL